MEDNKIIELYWNRSEQAIMETKNKYERLCTKISFNILHNNEDAEECVNETYFTVWNAIPTARPVYFSAFLCKISRNLSLKKMNYSHAQKRNSEALKAIDELENVLIHNVNLTMKLEEEELIDTINEFLNDLSIDKRNIFIRRYFFFDTITEISNLLGYSKSKVKSILSRDGKKLCNYLKERGYGNETR
ncbi:RNA polymerase sigma factor [Anaeromicropila populeti]|uniref:RNA polymerase sigma-70 factor, ECF subfamily n=1 Tax=Anaeromicropila populeti TaxID=37658 RepID=A0A1I6JCD5_9FIRM|nr:RNA polymerase sigma factor [Anaeromicropila populeti]SFR76665.1 RNA polymerase sigma-70 factor, ECF subfamily [Anaeromicropila populeti]